MNRTRQKPFCPFSFWHVSECGWCGHKKKKKATTLKGQNSSENVCEIWRTNKTSFRRRRFTPLYFPCLPINVFVLLMGDGSFSHSFCFEEKENIQSTIGRGWDRNSFLIVCTNIHQKFCWEMLFTSFARQLATWLGRTLSRCLRTFIWCRRRRLFTSLKKKLFHSHRAQWN